MTVNFIITLEYNGLQKLFLWLESLYLWTFRASSIMPGPQKLLEVRKHSILIVWCIISPGIPWCKGFK